MLRFDNLSKRFGDHIVFDNLSGTFGPGAVALCEEENTGKSTLLAVLAGVLAPDAGDVWIDGHAWSSAPGQARLRLAYVPDNCMAQPQWTGRALLEQVAQDRRTAVGPLTMQLADQLGLTPHLDKRFDQMSTGTRRKVYLTAAALGEPAVVIADGPTNGLDASARVALADVFKTWARDRVVIFASHDPAFVRACGARSVCIEGLR